MAALASGSPRARRSLLARPLCGALGLLGGSGSLGHGLASVCRPVLVHSPDPAHLCPSPRESLSSTRVRPVGGAQCLPQLALPMVGQSSPGLRVTPQNPGNKPILLPRWDPQRRTGVGCRGGPGPWAAWHPSKPPPRELKSRGASHLRPWTVNPCVHPVSLGPSCVVRKHSRCPAKVSKTRRAPGAAATPVTPVSPVAEAGGSRVQCQPQQCSGPLCNAARPDSKDNMKRAGLRAPWPRALVPSLVPKTANSVRGLWAAGPPCTAQAAGARPLPHQRPRVAGISEHVPEPPRVTPPHGWALHEA